MLQFFNFRSEPKNLKKQRVPEKKLDRSKNIIKWQTDRSKNNDFPQQLLQNVYNSPVGSAAIDVWQEFVEGDGLLDKKAGNTVINKEGQILNDLHAQLSADLSFMWGCSFIQRYSPEGKPTERIHLPFEESRLEIQEKNSEDVKKIYHNPYYGIPKSFDDKDTKWFYDFDPDPEHVKAEIAAHNIEFMDKKTGTVQPPYPGQAFWFSIEKPLARVYPQPFYYSSINWFQVDAEIQLFHERNIKNNLLLSVLINMHGDPSAPAGPPADTEATTDKTLDQGETVGDMMDRQMKTFQNEKGGILINYFKKDEEKATFEQFPTNSHHDLFTTLQNITADQIAIGTKVPKILVGISVPGQLGNTNEVLTSVAMMQGRTRRMRNILKRIYERVFEFVTDGTIKTISYIDIIPDQVWEVLTTEEKRKQAEERFNIELQTQTAEEIEDGLIPEIPENAPKEVKEIMNIYLQRDIQIMNVWKKQPMNDKQKVLLDRAILATQDVLDNYKIAS